MPDGSERLTTEDVTGHSSVGSIVTRFHYNRTNLLDLIAQGRARLEKLDRDYGLRRAELRGRIAQLEELLKALEDTENDDASGTS